MRPAIFARFALLIGAEVEIGTVSSGQISFEILGLFADFLEQWPKPRDAIIGDGLEHFFLRFEVIVESSASEFGFADNVAYIGGFISNPREDGARRFQKGAAIGFLCERPFAHSNFWFGFDRHRLTLPYP